MRKLHIIVPGVIGLSLVLAGGVTALVRKDPVRPTKSVQQQTVTKSETAASVATPAVESVQTTTPAPATPADPCNQKITETQTTSNSVNSKHTVVKCESSHGGTTSIEISNDVDQTATTGESTGGSGTTSNSTTTSIDIDVER